MGNPPGIRLCTDEEFRVLFTRYGARETAERLNCSERAVYKRRNTLARTMPMPAPGQLSGQEYPDFNTIEVKNGPVLVGSDFHLWPGHESVALRGFKKVCADVRPVAVVLNGDVLDFPQVSRHQPMGWEGAPEPAQEIECAQDHLNDIIKLMPRGAHKIWTLGNHDARFEGRLASVAREYKNIKGIHLSDHFPLWQKGWEVQVNRDVVIKHRWHNGIHATYNNTLKAGKTVVTGHLHSQQVRPYTDLNGTRYGIDTGCVASPWHKAFNYAENNPRNWISGFAVLSFKDGRLLQPELASVWDEKSIQFRGAVIKV
jgi:UDP-2,3-diacylglucosamine pyrophosphatase LpxH